MRIFVTGGLRPDHPEDEAAAQALGRAVTTAGHTLLQGYYNDFDHLVASAAYEAAKSSGKFEEPKLAVLSFVTSGIEAPAEVEWLVRGLPYMDWDPKEEGWSMPEPIESCDVAIVLGGGPKTLRAANLCRMAGKPLLPITALGGATREVFQRELSRFSDKYEGRVSRDRYSIIDSQNPKDFDTLAADVVALAARLVGGNSVFIIMTFREESEDTFSTIKDVVEDAGMKWERTDQDPTTDRIYGRIVEGIQSAALVVADVTFTSLNVYYELGFAEALEKQVIVIAREKTELPFDVGDIPVTYFRNHTRLKKALAKRITALAGAP